MMTATSRAKATTKPQSARIMFIPPDAALARIWTPCSVRERMILDEALTPTLRRYADALSGRSAYPRAEDVIWATPEGLRHFLLHDLRRERARHVLTPAMIAFAWYRTLSQAQRETLTRYAVTGVYDDALAARHTSARTTAQSALFDVVDVVDVVA